VTLQSLQEDKEVITMPTMKLLQPEKSLVTQQLLLTAIEDIIMLMASQQQLLVKD
jgi:hypothetical protein